MIKRNRGVPIAPWQALARKKPLPERIRVIRSGWVMGNFLNSWLCQAVFCLKLLPTKAANCWVMGNFFFFLFGKILQFLFLMFV